MRFGKMNFLAKFYDAFDFSTCYKTAVLTDAQLQAFEEAIKDQRVIISGFDEKSQTTYQWVPIKIWEADSEEGRAQLLIAEAEKSNIF